MTNEEMIEKLEQDGLSALSDMEFITNALEENTKLKAEIEQLKWKLSSVETQRDLKGYDAKRNADIMSSQLKIIEQLKSELEQWQSTNLKLVCELTRIECENNQLKSELEQSVRLPCKVGDVVYECDKDVKEIKCYKIKRMQSVTIELDFIGDIFTRSKLVSCGSEYIGNLIFLTREEAEQALKVDISKMETTTAQEDDLK